MTTCPSRHRLVAALIALLLGHGPTAALALDGQLNLNTATVEQLELLPTIGATRAKTIADYRRQHGPFRSVDQLLDRKLIGESTLAAIRPYLILSGATTLNATPSPKAAGSPNRPARQEITFSRHLATRPGEVQILPDEEYFPTLLQSIAQASRRIELAMFLFKTTESSDNRPAQLAKALINARGRGVQVEVLLEKSGYDAELNRENEKVAQQLQKQRIDVRFDTPATTTHTKLVVIDHRYVFIGSHNLTQAALKHNHEFSLLIDNAALAREISDYIGQLRTQE